MPSVQPFLRETCEDVHTAGNATEAEPHAEACARVCAEASAACRLLRKEDGKESANGGGGGHSPKSKVQKAEVLV